MQGLRLGGHPVHPALVHFPVACWTAAPVLDGLHLLGYGLVWWQCAYGCIALGLVMALAAMTAGFMDFMAIAPEHPGQAVAVRHMMLMASAWCVFCVDLLLRPFHTEPSSMQAWTGLGCSLAGFLLLLTGAYAGARLVYDFGVGQTRTPGK
ncbi:MAG TPA: DUF2231 domain-containing protein [Gammaproteobacteria bacterium]|nr:DUF2231 domain-containing protein [Gammaproteobacteria bacterium]